MKWSSRRWHRLPVPALHSTIEKALRRTATVFGLAVNALWAIPSVMFIRAARRWVTVRMGILESSRIGHFTIDACVFLASRSMQAPNERTIDVFWFAEPTCNEQWARMVRRQLFVGWWVKYLALFNRLIPGGAAHDLSLHTASPLRDSYTVPQRSTARFEFTPGEEERAKAWLHRRGWRDGEPFVCLLVRDSAYLASHPLHASGDRWTYHNYRDADIDTYIDAVQAMVTRGYWVIRLGKIAHMPLSLHHRRVIDYPFAQDQDDVLDIWLAINCRFFISSSTGIDITVAFYGRPVVFVNALPLNLAQLSLKHIWVPKHLRWKDTRRPLTLKEHCQHGYTLSADYEKAGIVIDGLSPVEIAAAVTECEQRVAGTWVATDADEDRQRRYWQALRRWPDFHIYHSDVHPEARVGSAWLRSMGDAFLD